jgi:hypothetical protein
MDSWSSTNSGSVNRDIKNVKKKLERLKNQNYLRNQKEIQIVLAQLDELLYREEIMWR